MIADHTARQITAFAIVAHPDDVEFMMAGTLLLMKDAGADIHIWNLCNGCCGSTEHSYEETKRLRWQEAQAAAREVGAHIYPPIADDLALFYDAPSIAKVAALIRRVKPDVILTQPPLDYMEDHMNACRLAVTAAFARAMPNYRTEPPEPHYVGDTVIYHAMPAGLKTGLRQPFEAEAFVDIGGMIARKRSMLAKHSTQSEWLNVSQGMDSYLNRMEEICRQMGKLSGRFEFAEGWRRHLHLGYGPEDADPMRDLLQERVVRNSRAT
jgi:N-acetylglucosamine malate deacetylase 1